MMESAVIDLPEPDLAGDGEASRRPQVEGQAVDDAPRAVLARGPRRRGRATESSDAVRLRDTVPASRRAHSKTSRGK